MKGAIGNALIMNLVITFIVIFYMLLISSMAYSKAYRVKNYLLNAILDVENTYNHDHLLTQYTTDSVRKELKKSVDEYLSKVGYILNDGTSSCPNKMDQNYFLRVGDDIGYYKYCVYYRLTNVTDSDVFDYNYSYMVLAYMKFDFPVVGDFIKIPITGETKTFWHLKNS